MRGIARGKSSRNSTVSPSMLLKRVAGLVTVLLVGCASDRTVLPSPDTDWTTWEPRYEAVSSSVVSVLGTFGQSISIYQLANRRLQDGLMRCMPKQGFAYQRQLDPDYSSIPGYDSMPMEWWAFPDLNYAEAKGYGMVARLAVPKDLLSLTTPDPPVQIQPSEVETYDNAINQCTADLERAGELKVPEIETLDALRHDLESRVDIAVKDIRQDFGSCIESAGFGSADSPEAMFDLLEDNLNGASQVEPDSPEFAKALEMERSVATRDVLCRRELASSLVPQLELAVTEWSEANGPIIGEVGGWWS